MKQQPPLFPEFASDGTGAFATYPVAVIELGTSAIRMVIGQTDGVSGIKRLEQLLRGVSLGKDTFTRGDIRRETLQQCVDVLRSYRRKLDEYQCTNPAHIRVVATSAVREASNRMAFLDRIYTATGFNVEPIDDAEIARETYLAMRPVLESHPDLTDATVMLMEVGGGSTDVLLLQGPDIQHAHSYRLGSLRLQEMLKQYSTSADQSRSVMAGQIERVLEQIRDVLPIDDPVQLVALGGDVRFAAGELQHDLTQSPIVTVPLKELSSLTRDLLRMSPEQIVRRHHVELTQAETLAPALLTYVLTAQMLNTDELLVTPFNLRDALLSSLLRSADWTEYFCEQVIGAAREFARRHHVDLVHAEHVARLSRQLFRALQSEHGMDLRGETILYTAALLHEVGLFISQTAYHKHSYYLISHGELFGLNALDHQLVALVARYHRRAVPKPTHDAYARLSRENRVILLRLAGLLRLAKALDHSRSQRVRSVECTVERERLVIHADAGAGDLSLEQMILRRESVMFKDVFGLSVLLRSRNTLP